MRLHAIKNARSINFNGAISIKAVSPPSKRKKFHPAATIVLRVHALSALPMLTRLFVFSREYGEYREREERQPLSNSLYSQLEGEETLVLAAWCVSYSCYG